MAAPSNRDAAARAAIAAQVALVVVVVAVPELAFAQATMPGQQLLTFREELHHRSIQPARHTDEDMAGGDR